MLDSRTNDTRLVPPGGHVVGVYAGTDIARGVHKAPANVDLRGIVTRDLPGDRKPLEYLVNKRQQDILNPKGINVFRDFRADRRGIRVWGARTLSADAQWKYVNVRRLFIFVEESIDEGVQWVVFEPNSEPTWDRVRAQHLQLPDERLEERRTDGNSARGGVLRPLRPHDHDASRKSTTASSSVTSALPR